MPVENPRIGSVTCENVGRKKRGCATFAGAIRNSCDNPRMDQNQERRARGQSPYDAFGVPRFGVDAGTLGEMVKNFTAQANADAAETIRQMTAGTVSADIRRITSAATAGATGAVPDFAAKVSEAYWPQGSSVFQFARMVQDAQVENERVLRGLASAGMVSQEMLSGMPAINSQLLKEISELTMPTESILAVCRQIVDGATTPIGSLTTESMRSLMRASGTAEAVLGSAGAFARLAELSARAGHDEAIDDDLSEELEEALNDPKLRVFLQNIIGVVVTQLAVLSAATGHRTGELLSYPWVRVNLAGVATTVAILLGYKTFPQLIDEIGAASGWICLVIVQAIQDLAEQQDETE